MSQGGTTGPTSGGFGATGFGGIGNPPPYTGYAQPGMQTQNTLAGGPGGVTPPTPGPSPMPYQQVAPLTPQQLQAMQMTGQQAGGAQNFLNLAEAQQAATIGGAYTGLNPWLDQYYNAAALPVVQNYQYATAPNNLYSGATTGTLGSSGQQQAMQYGESGLGQALGNLAAGMFEPAYQYGLGLQQSAAQNAPNLAAGQFGPEQALMQSGQIGQQQAQNVLQSGYQNLTGQSQWPYQALGMLGQALAPFGGGGTSISVGQMPLGAGGIK